MRGDRKLAWEVYPDRKIKFMRWCRGAPREQLIQALNSAEAARDSFRRRAVVAAWDQRFGKVRA